MKLTSKEKQLVKEYAKKLVEGRSDEFSDENLIKGIKNLLPHMYQKDADHNDQSFLKRYQNGSLKSGVIFDYIKKFLGNKI